MLTIVALGVVGALGGAPAIQPRPPRIQVFDSKSLDWLTEEAQWENSGGKEGAVSVEAAEAREGEKALHFRVNIDWHNEGMYPQGWPSFQYKPPQPLDFSGYNAIRFWVKAESSRPEGKPLFRFILWTGEKGRLNQPIAGLEWGQWTQASFDLSSIPELEKVTLLHFFLCESDFRHADALHFVVDGFELVRTRSGIEANPADRCSMELFLRPGDEAVILDKGAPAPAARLVFHTGEQCALSATCRLLWRARELFSGKVTSASQPLDQPVPAGQRTEREVVLPWGQLATGPGYYVLTCDVQEGGKSVTDGWVGCDDLYVRGKDEPMTYTVLSLRLGMSDFVRDRVFGGLMGRTRIALPHTLDPYADDTYLEFVRLFAHWTGKHAEGLEAGLTGLVFSGEALRRYGDTQRADFNDRILRDSIDYMIDRMQLQDGSTLVERNDLVDEYGEQVGGKGGATSMGFRDSNQIGEWMRPICRAVIYWQRLGLNDDYCEVLLRACRRASNFLLRESVAPLDRWNNVLYHYHFVGFGPEMTKTRYHQEGRQCDVYVGRALSGLSYYAYALQLMGHRVPPELVACLRDTTEWAYEKMKAHDGWFDYQCLDEVEGGCHTFLGNMYISEATFGWYLAAERMGLEKDAALAAEATRLGYHYVTDNCYIRGRKFDVPLEFWVGPYLYWELTEYLSAVGPDDTFSAWLRELHEKWAVERQWRDFLDRAPGRASRTDTNGALEIAILGYLGLRLMEEIGQPFSY